MDNLSVSVLHKCVIVHYGLESILSREYNVSLTGFTELEQLRSADLLFLQVPEFVEKAASLTSMPTIFLSDANRIELLQDAISLGASGFLLMTDSASEILQVTEDSLTHHKLRAQSSKIEQLMRQLEDKRRRKIKCGEHLTSRDVEVLELLVQGKDNKQIADELSITYGSARNRVSMLLNKTSKSNRTALALWATENNIVEEL